MKKYFIKNLEPLAIGVSIGLAFYAIIMAIESIILKIALIFNT